MSALSAGVSGCSAVSLLNAASPSGHYERTTDVRYGADARQLLDIYLPAGRAPEALIVFFYGGGWTEGDKDDYRFVASALTRAGFGVVIPDYRLHPEVAFPAFVEDGAAALAEVLNGEIPTGDRNPGISSVPVFLMGHSAGAHIAAMLALDERFLGAYGIEPDKIDGFIGLSGPYDFLPIRAGYLKAVFPESSRDQSQPVRFADKAAPPTLLIHGSDDEKVLPSNSESLAAKLRSAGAPVEYLRYERTGHARTVAALAPPLQFLASTLDDTRTFIQARVAEARSGRPKSAAGAGRSVSVQKPIATHE
jgi:acetyl esterase/lipase